MNSNLKWKVVAILAVVALAVFSFYPPQQKVRLGLDLKGGVHLVMRVQTDDALKVETEAVAERLREDFTTKNIAFTSIAAEPPNKVVVTGVQNEQAFRAASDEITAAGYDRSGGSGSFTFTLKPNIERTLRDESVTQALQTIERRVNELGVAEPIVATHGAADQILVQMPGVTDVNRAKEIIRSTALLELKIVEGGPTSTREALLQATGGAVPDNMEVVLGVGDGVNAGATVFYLVRKVAAVTGRDLRNARASLDENNQPAVGFTLNNEGAAKFGRVTQDNIGRQLAIILDGKVQSAPVIQSRITDEGRISGGAGGFTTDEVQNLSLMLRSGALPASLTYLEERTVGPTLGADSVRAGVYASVAGLALVALFMLAYYKVTGINEIVSVALNLVILLGFMAYIGATMTLPGIAGFILTIGMGVDSNVLIFERIKEELATGKGVRQSIAAGFDRVFLTILDTHVASLISAAFLFQFGTGPIRGFATTLTFGLLSNVFTAVFVSRTLFEVILGKREAKTLSI